LTDAEKEFVDRYLAVIDQVGAMNPGVRDGHTYAYLRAAQALVSEAKKLLVALELMMDRGEREIYADTLARALLAFDGERRSLRVRITGQAPHRSTP
jgi:hypothetical protein